MNDARAVGAVKRVGDLCGLFQGLVNWDGTLRDTFGESFSLHILHHHVACSVLIAHIMEDTDIGVIKRGECTCFTFESCTEIIAVSNVFRQNFDGHGAVEPCVAGTINLTHSTGSKSGENLIRADFVTGA